MSKNVTYLDEFAILITKVSLTRITFYNEFMGFVRRLYNSKLVEGCSSMQNRWKQTRCLLFLSS